MNIKVWTKGRDWPEILLFEGNKCSRVLALKPRTGSEEKWKTKNFLGSKAGCGTCDENKIDNSCVDCRGLNCNIKDKLKESVFCYERKEDGNEKEGGRPCKSKFCFISVDVNKGN